MFEFFDQISNAFSAVIDFFISLFNYIIQFFKVIASGVSFLVEVVTVLPVPVQAGILCIISVAVIYLIVGRN